MFREQWERILRTLEAVTAWVFSKDRLIRWGLWLVTLAKGILVGLVIAGLCELIFSETVKHGLESAQTYTRTALAALQPFGLASAFIGKLEEPISDRVRVVTEPATFFWNCKEAYTLARCFSDVQKPRARVAAERRIEARDKLRDDTDQKCLRGEIKPLNESLRGSNPKETLLLQCNVTANLTAGSSEADRQIVASYQAVNRRQSSSPYSIFLTIVFLPLAALIETIHDLFIGKTAQIVTIVGLIVGAISSSIYLLDKKRDWKAVVFLFPIITVAMASLFALALQCIMMAAIFALSKLIAFVGLGCAAGATATVIHKSTEVLIDEIRRHVRFWPH
jgi:hypothetical protein